MGMQAPPSRWDLTCPCHGNAFMLLFCCLLPSTITEAQVYMHHYTYILLFVIFCLAVCSSVESPMCLRSVHHSFQVYLLSPSPPSPQCSSYFPELILFIIQLSVCTNLSVLMTCWSIWSTEDVQFKNFFFIFHCTGEGRNFEDCFAHSQYILKANMIPGKSRIHSRITWMVTNLELPKYT